MTKLIAKHKLIAKLRENIPLSTGRIVIHTHMSNGAQLATPTPGALEMTNEEWCEYCEIIRGPRKDNVSS